MSFLLALTLMQVGPNPGTSPITAVPLELAEQRSRSRTAERTERASNSTTLIQECQSEAAQNGAAAETDARSWLSVAEGQERALAQHCLGLALANQAQWAGSAIAFETAFGLVPESSAQYRTQLAALAGNARLTGGEMQRALDILGAAAVQAEELEMYDLLGEIEIDRARAFVATQQNDAAVLALEIARDAKPGSALAWLLSATLSRREDDLAAAQSQIERAAALDPRDPAIGLEAGLIAALAGFDDAARQSWQSVIALAPGGPEAAAARDYLTQIEGS